ncbi:MAG: DUF4160 domain-containing protein [Lachnospiraceae bacterium]|nr:DUF4160 domain-containing protein [Lachnospiraceae bacterium]
MPQIFKIGSYLIYFWSNEDEPLEPIHVHVSEGVPSENSTKIWLTKSGRCLLCNNNSYISARKLKNIMDIIEARHFEIEKKWCEYFKKIQYYC